jgi:GNAT superfamily N-acetyltransferase
VPKPASAYSVRPAVRADAKAWLDLVGELADFEKLRGPTPAARARLRRDAFGPRPKIQVYVATSGKVVVGYAILAWTYSSFLAKPTLWLEDIYVTKAHRGTGLADRMLNALAQHALKRRAGRLEGIVLDWNAHAQAFYLRTGAELKREWILLRYDEDALRRLARGP